MCNTETMNILTLRCNAAVVCVGLIFGFGCGREKPPTDVGCSESEVAPPNILLISLDACRSDRLGCYGHERNTSPFIDELAAAGIRYENAFVNTHGTPPSHTTMLSSLYQQSHGVSLGGNPPAGVAERIPASVIMLQEILRGAGYTTIGVSGGGNMSARQGFGRGFVEFDDRRGKATAQRLRLLKLIDRHHVPQRPLFMLYHTYEIHSPYDPPPPWNTHFGSFSSTIDPTNKFLMSIVNTASTALDDDDLQHLLSLYDGGIRFTDTVLKGLFAKLEERGLLENTLVVITSDHGEEFAEHGGLLHRGTLYEELVHVPLILWGAGVPGGVVEERLVSSIDIMPTILGAAGVAAPWPVAGRDLLSERPDGADGGHVFFQYGHRLYGIRGQRWKLIVNPGRDKSELYDLETDPLETVNLVNEHATIASELAERINAWRAGLQESTSPVPVSLSAEETEQLKVLGYVGGDIGEQ